MNSTKIQNKYEQSWIIYTMNELNKINKLKFYTYKKLLYILINLKLLTYNQKNSILSKYYDNLTK